MVRNNVDQMILKLEHSDKKLMDFTYIIID